MKKFKVGDKVVCIDNSYGGKPYEPYTEKYKVYTISKVSVYSYILMLEEIPERFISVKRFISLKEFRLRKINKFFK
jgi:hypothetical protein